MGKVSEITVAEQSESLLEHRVLNETGVGESQLSPGVREITAVEDEGSKATVSSAHLFLLTCCLGGLQVVWSVILSNGSPFLVFLGLSKSLTALIWIAAPLCGTVVQPIVGSFGDRSSSRFGRRRPFILGGSIGIAISILALAWTPELVGMSTAALGNEPQESSTRKAAVLLAILWIYALNISIQFVQSGARALIIESCPADQQAQASAWASIMPGAGNILGYLFGFSALPEIFSTNFTQFQCLSIIASISMLSTALIGCLTTRERPLRHTNSGNGGQLGLFTLFKDLIRIYRQMPRRIRRICYIQFFAWMGWFPFLFYSTTYVGEFYRTQSSPPTSAENPPLTTASTPLTQNAIRHGTFANFLFAIVTLLFNTTLPLLLSLSPAKNSRSSFPPPPKFGIARTWTLSHFVLASALFSTFFISSPLGATLLVALVGFSWALTMWAPYAIIGEEVAALAELVHDVAAPRSLEIQAASIMGIHNAAISAPQVVAALVCSAVFGIVKAGGWGNGTAWVMRVGGVAAMGAGCLAWGSEF